MGDFMYASELVRAARAMDAERLGHDHIRLAGDYFYPLEQFARLRTYEQQRLVVLAAGLRARKAVLTGKSAARLLGGWAMLTEQPEPVELALCSRTAPPRSKTPVGTVYRRVPLRDDEILDAYGARCTTPLRTTFDVAARHGFREGLVCADWALSQAGVRLADMHRELSCSRRFVGIGTVRRVLEHATGMSESPYESWFRAVLIERRIPFTFQPSIGKFRPDFLIKDLVAVEIDGNSKYAGRAEEELLREKRRQDALTNMGFIFARFSPLEIVREEERVIRTILQLVENRGRPLG